METQNTNPEAPSKPQLNYPITFDMKLIISAEYPIEATKDQINEIFNQCMVPNTFNFVRASSKGNYLSYSYTVIMLDKQQMDETYEAIKSIQGIKFAL